MTKYRKKTVTFCKKTSRIQEKVHTCGEIWFHGRFLPVILKAEKDRQGGMP